MIMMRPSPLGFCPSSRTIIFVLLISFFCSSLVQCRPNSLPSSGNRVRRRTPDIISFVPLEDRDLEDDDDSDDVRSRGQAQGQGQEKEMRERDDQTTGPDSDDVETIEGGGRRGGGGAGSINPFYPFGGGQGEIPVVRVYPISLTPFHFGSPAFDDSGLGRPGAGGAGVSSGDSLEDLFGDGVFLQRMNEIMRRMQEQMDIMIRGIHNDSLLLPSSSSEEDDDDHTGILHSLFGGGIGNIPANYSNSTSDTKVIDGNIVTVNETIHSHDSDGLSSVFRIKVINVRPQNATSTETTTTTKPKEEEGAEDVLAVNDNKDKEHEDRRPEENEIPGEEGNRRGGRAQSGTGTDDQATRGGSGSGGIDDGLTKA